MKSDRCIFMKHQYYSHIFHLILMSGDITTSLFFFEDCIGPTMHHTSSFIQTDGHPFLFGIKSFGSTALLQLTPIKVSTSIFWRFDLSSTGLFRQSLFIILSSVTRSEGFNSNYVIGHVLWRFIQLLCHQDSCASPGSHQLLLFIAAQYC